MKPVRGVERMETMSVLALLLALTLGSAPVPGNAVVISTAGATDWTELSLSVKAWPKNEVRVVQTESSSNVRAKIERDGGTTRITADYVGPRTTKFFGLFKSGDNRHVHWTIYVPERTALTVQSTNGAIAISGVRAAIDAETTNGAISIAQAGPAVNAHTSNGRIDIGVASFDGAPPKIDAVSTNGPIDLRLPAGTTTRVEANTTNGTIANPLQSGRGPGSITIETTNGGIRVRVG